MVDQQNMDDNSDAAALAVDPDIPPEGVDTDVSPNVSQVSAVSDCADFPPSQLDYMGQSKGDRGNPKSTAGNFKSTLDYIGDLDEDVLEEEHNQGGAVAKSWEEKSMAQDFRGEDRKRVSSFRPQDLAMTGDRVHYIVDSHNRAYRLSVQQMGRLRCYTY